MPERSVVRRVRAYSSAYIGVNGDKGVQKDNKPGG